LVASGLGATRIVWPSGAALATMFEATTVPAPGRFSTTNGLPKRSVSFCARKRAARSIAPPGANGSTKLTCLVG